ncbi:hypothetical protein [Peptoniphilus stercorisuis]|uniref:GTP cyclohydrolase 1 type 2 n=1 Tax=Peptoniphilus stercorisuis TaxID=1436965 RepID=A0ABS4KB83_9FIRM|nr:hypothetical protein [Peptoniphilus stercorisuis]MBP2024600.1 hypothetical protein [Peptoniphilus stercorisuis]
MLNHLKIEVFIPEEYVVEIVNGLNESNVLREGNYDYVFATTKVKGHFRPIEGANPFSGEIGVVHECDEVKMEFRIKEEDLDEVRKIIEIKHPYEEPIINIIKLIE